MFVIVLLVGLVTLIVGAELLVRGGGRLAVALRVPVLIVALTIVAFGTSMPEILVSIKSAVDGSPEMALANVTGSNIANIALVLGCAAMVRPLKVGRELMRREIPVVLLLQLMVPALLFDGMLSRIDGMLLILTGVSYNALLIRDAMAGRRQVEDVDELADGGDLTTNGALLVIGLTLLLVGAELFVDGAIDLAEYFGLDKRVIGLTVVALGTSAPEVMTAIISSWRDEAEMAVGNSLGSNILNISMALGLTALVAPIPLSDHAVWGDLAVVVVVTVMLVPVVLRGRVISRMEGGMLVGGYLIYIAMLAAS